MRYALNEKIWTMFAHIKDGFMYPSYGRLREYFSVTEWPRLEFLEMEVVAHHKVPGEWDSKEKTPENDGFILKCSKGLRWFNQYPYASYGQMSDTSDGLFRLDDKGDQEHLVAQLVEWIDKGHRKDADEAPLIYETYDLFRELRSMRRDVHTLMTGECIGSNQTPDTTRGEKLMEWHDHIIAEFAKQTGLHITGIPHMFHSEKEGGLIHLNGWFDYSIYEQPVAS